MGTVLVTFREMRFLFIACLAVTVSAAPQANFGKKIEVNERLGLLANDPGLDPTAETSQSAALTAETSAGASGQLPSGRVPGGEEIGEPAGESQCCCVPQDEQCDDPFAGEDLVGLGLIDPRKKPLNSINTRIVNRPGSGSSAPQLSSCPVGQKTCCYDASCPGSGLDPGMPGDPGSSWWQAVWDKELCLLYQVSAMGRPALVSSPGPVFSSTRTMTSSAPALSYQMTPPTTIMWPLGRLSLLPINSRVWSRLTCLKSELENTMLLVLMPLKFNLMRNTR